MRSVIQNGRYAAQPFCEQKKVAYCSEMAINAIEIHFRSSKMGGGGITMAMQPVNHSGYTQYLPLGKYTNSSLQMFSKVFQTNIKLLAGAQFTDHQSCCIHHAIQFVITDMSYADEYIAMPHNNISKFYYGPYDDGVITSHDIFSGNGSNIRTH